MDGEIKRLSEFKELHWDVLLDSIAQNRVVPVIGPEMLVWRGEAFYAAAARLLAAKLGVDFREGESVDAVASRHLAQGGTAGEVRAAMNAVLRDTAAEAQPLLDKLVSTGVFRLYLSATPDSFLANALAKAGTPADVWFFSTNRDNCDIPAAKLAETAAPVVYHLYGKAASFIEYAVTENDRLEFSCRWMDSRYRPANLARHLADKYLLVLGCGYENWLARFFLYGLKGKGLFANLREAPGLVADSRAPCDRPLGVFLSRCRGGIYYGGGAAAFIEELARRVAALPPGVLQKPPDEFEPGSVFISYAKEDRPAALKIKERLESCNLPVWLDKAKLESGEEYDDTFKRNIERASIFIPVMSRTSVESVVPRYFRKEWVTAGERAKEYPPTVPFIHPVAVEAVEPTPNVPDAIAKVQWIDAPGGDLAEDAIDRLVELIGKL